MEELAWVIVLDKGSEQTDDKNEAVENGEQEGFGFLFEGKQ